MMLTGLLITLVILLLVTLVSRNVRRSILAETQKRGVAIAQLFGATNLNYLKSYYYLGIQQNAQVAKKESELEYVIVYDKEGLTAAHTENQSLILRPASDPEALESIQAKAVLFREINLLKGSPDLKDQVFDISIPVNTKESPGRWGTIRVGISPEHMNQTLRAIRKQILQLGLIALVFGVLGAMVLANRISTPISKLMAGSLRAAEGDLSHHIEVNSGDELGGLAHNFNYMMDQIRQHQEERIKSEKMAAVGYMVNTIVHDCRTPITVIKGFASVLKDFQVSAEQSRECLDFINFEVERMERMLEEILQFATDKKPPLVLEDQNLDEFIRECAVEIDALFKNTQITFTQDLKGNSSVKIDRDKLRRAILNIASNAKEALKGRGDFKLSTRSNQSHALIELYDNGGGIPENLQAKIFEPFFSHGKSGGFGLGMSITRKIVDDHSGKISLESGKGKGTTFIIQIPLAQSRREKRSIAHSGSA